MVIKRVENIYFINRNRIIVAILVSDKVVFKAMSVQRGMLHYD